MLRHVLVLAALALIPLAWAQDVSIVPEIPPLPADTLPAPAVPAPVDVPPSLPAPTAMPLAPKPVALPGVRGTLTVARTLNGMVPLTFTIRAGGTPIMFGVRRDNAQNCAFAPLVRVVQVGTQQVVYPAAGSQKRLCTQEIVTKSTASTGMVSFSRDLPLPPGEYMVESWLTGLANGQLVKVAALPVRVSVK